VDDDDVVDQWLRALEERQLANLTFHEVSRALRALSSTYVERRRRLAEGAALAGAGKRAACALFYAPLHFLIVRRIAAEIHDAASGPKLLVDLGCGTGAAGAGWAMERRSITRVLAVDRHPWALGEAAWTYRQFGIDAGVRRADVATLRLPRDRAAVLAAFTINELSDSARQATLETLIERAAGGSQVLIVEPVAKRAAPWWNEWRDRFERAGGRADEWRFRSELPPLVAKLDRAAGLDHRELTARSLWINGSG
jgi:predicted RNA methylase